METIIVLAVSCIGSYFGRMDFFTLHFLVALSVELCHKWNAFTNDKHVF